MGSPVRKRRKLDSLVTQSADSEDEILTITSRKSSRVAKPTARLLDINASQRASIGEQQDSTQEEGALPVTPAKRKKLRIVADGTPVKQLLNDNDNETDNLPTPSKLIETPRRALVSNADQSARRKSARRLVEREEEDSAEDGLEEEEILAQRILSDEENEDQEAEPASDEEHPQQLPQTPSKRGRGRPRKPPKPKRTPTPPRNLPPHEKYFFDNRPGGSKTSDNTLSNVSLLNHEEYYNTIKAWQDPHQPEIEHLETLHARAFDQWIFELEQDFNICLYGWGSKRALLTSFADHFLNSSTDEEAQGPPEIIVVNGTSPTLTLRSILLTLASLLPSLVPTHTLPTQPTTILALLLPALSTHPSRITLLIHSLDSPFLRRPAAQSLLSTLASHPKISIIASVDTPRFPLLWDISQRSRFNFLFHDATTFRPLDVELQGSGGGVVDEVNKLLGRSGRRVDGREGVGYVLRSLPENARRLFGLLVAECLALADEGAVEEDGGADKDDDEDVDMDDGEHDEDDFEAALTGGNRKGTKRRNNAGGGNNSSFVGVEYRSLYQKAVQAFIATNEIAFRTLLKEFHDHAMIVSRKDGTGGEMLGVPFRREELLAILEDLGVE